MQKYYWVVYINIMTILVLNQNIKAQIYTCEKSPLPCGLLYFGLLKFSHLIFFMDNG
jgi:hypothetical protein